MRWDEQTDSRWPTTATRWRVHSEVFAVEVTTAIGQMPQLWYVLPRGHLSGVRPRSRAWWVAVRVARTC